MRRRKEGRKGKEGEGRGREGKGEGVKEYSGLNRYRRLSSWGLE